MQKVSGGNFGSVSSAGVTPCPRVSERQNKRTALQGGELLLCVRGSTGIVSIASPELVGANVMRGIVPIRFNRSLLLPEFGFYLISAGPVQSQIREKTYGTALMQINIRDLRVISLSIPPLKEQKTIVAKLDGLSEETQRLATIYERKLAALDELKKSLLHGVLGEFIGKQDLLDTCQQLGVGFDDVQTKAPETRDRKGGSVR